MSDCELDDTLPNISIQEPNASIADQSNCQDNRLRVTYLHRLMKEYDQRSEMNKRQIENIDPEIINYQPNAYDINDENIELDAKQKRLLKMIAGNSSGNFPILKPELERFFLLEKSNRLRYNYPPECCTETYKQLLREAAPNITDSKITTYAMSLTDQFRFKVFFDQIPSIELKKQILDSFLLNCLTFKSTLKLHHAYGLIEGVLDDTSELSCPEWYITDMLLLKFFVSLGLNVNRFKATFPNILEVFTDCDTEEAAKQNEETQDNKQVGSKIFEMSLRHILRLTRNSIIKRLTLYENQEFYVIFYLMCAVVLDANIENDESIQEEVGDIFEQLFNLDFLDIDELSATLIKGLRLNNQTIAYHRLVYLIKRINTMRKCSKKLSDFSTHFALSCLYGIFKEFTNEISTVNEELSTPKMVDLIIDLLEKHSIDIYKDNSYKMFNVIELLTILVNSYILNLENANVYMKRLMNIIENAIHSVRDHIYDLGIIQVKIILSHFTDKCDNFLDKYKVDEQMDTSLNHSLIE